MGMNDSTQERITHNALLSAALMDPYTTTNTRGDTRGGCMNAKTLISARLESMDTAERNMKT